MNTDQHRAPKTLLACLAIVVVTVIIYLPTVHFDFVNYDDDGYVYANPRVCAGLNASTLRWAFLTDQMAGYQPLTWLSYAADVSVFGKNPHAMHIENAVWHGVNSLLVFLVFWGLTTSWGKSALLGLL